MSDLRAYGYASGNYMNRCLACEKEFRGDKRARTCKGCASLKADTALVLEGKEPEHGSIVFKCNPES